MQLRASSLYPAVLNIPGVSPESRFLLAVSGGIDSMVMLDLFLHLRKTRNIEFSVSHIDHGIRDTSGKDAEFVKKFCRKNNVICTVQAIDVPGVTADSSESLEMTARRLRYEALQLVASDQDADVICTAHHANDQAETILIRLFSGTGLYGLQGIRKKRANIIRPLLAYTREQIEHYAQEYQVPFRDDPTNLSHEITRNRIRHHLLPMLEQEYNPAIVQALNRFSTIQSEAQAFIHQQALEAKSAVLILQSDTEIMLDIQGVRVYFTAIQKALITQCFFELGLAESPLNFDQYEQITTLINSAGSGAELILHSDAYVVVDRNFLYFTTKNFREIFVEIFHENGNYKKNRYTISAEMLVADEVSREKLIKADELTAYFDADFLLQQQIYWRNWRDGDVLQLANGKMKKVSDIWIDLKVPLWEKYLTPLLATDSEVLWIPGYKRSGKGWVSQHTTQIYKLTAERST